MTTDNRTPTISLAQQLLQDAAEGKFFCNADFGLHYQDRVQEEIDGIFYTLGIETDLEEL